MDSPIGTVQPAIRFGSGLGFISAQFAARLQSTTPNALLGIPCDRYVLNIVAALDPDGNLRLLSYLPPSPAIFDIDGAGTPVILRPGAPPQPMTLDGGPQAGCAVDPLGRSSFFVPARGDLVRLLGAGFGPDHPLSLVAVRVAGTPARILSVGPGEVSFLIPCDTATTNFVPVTLQTENGVSPPFPLEIEPYAFTICGTASP